MTRFLRDIVVALIFLLSRLDYTRQQSNQSQPVEDDFVDLFLSDNTTKAPSEQQLDMCNTKKMIIIDVNTSGMCNRVSFAAILTIL